MPPVSPGSWVTASFVQNWNRIKDGEPCIIITQNDGIVFKMVTNQLEKDNTFLLCSTNPAYEPYAINVAEVSEIWRFEHYISAELPEPNLSRDELAQAVVDLQREVALIRNTMRPKV